MAKFQIKLGGHWQDYEAGEDKVLKRAFMAGFPNAKFSLRGQEYVYDFKRMTQHNKQSGKDREIRAPHKMQPPSAPVVPAGPTTVITVPPGSPGTTIMVPHPKGGGFIAVNVPPSARPGQAMLVPVPPQAIPSGPGGAPPAAPVKKDKGGMSTGAKVAVGGAVVGVGVGGALLGVHMAEHGAEATGEMLGDAAADAGDAIVDAGEAIGDAAVDAGIVDFAVDAGDFIVDAADSAGDFIDKFVDRSTC